ncbi:glucosyltransferase domain-containing protein [Bacillus sp. CGMCC 1.16541]|uniref:glucosyltransferase domain-containing protein n=1 Tax=Bacillus sp. CGMCC 1.16541 TaxID=2185143 RepID=UPI000D73F671|nr:glucosyltransferase domain-containing protein [Bacillus sp. CGMCC 1.16541]
MPEEFLKKLKEHTKSEWKLAFISAAVIGLLTHMYVFTNMLPNHDGLTNIYNTQLKFQSGRFFLGPLSGISSFFDLPWVNGIVAIFYLALMTVIVVELFEIRKTVSIILTAGLIVTFPTVSATFSYMFTADGYMAGNLLAVVAILLTKKYRFGFIPASLIFYISVGVYQANLPLLLMFIAVWLIRELLFTDLSIVALTRYMIRFVSMTVIGMGLYALTFKGYQHFFSGKITDYQGLDQIGQSSGSVTDQLMKINDSFLAFFFRGFLTDAPVNVFELLNIGLFMTLVFMIVWSLVRNKLYTQISRMLMLVVCVGSLPILTYMLYFVSPGVEYHMLMVMSLVTVYLLPIIFYDRIEFPSFLANTYSWSVVVLSVMTIFNFAIISNIAYFNMSLKYERSYATVNRMLDRMEQTEGYEQATQIAVIGYLSMKTELSSVKVADNIPSMTGAMGDTFLFQPYHYEYMLANQFGKKLNRVDEEELAVLRASDTVREMDSWPASDSIKVVEDTLIIKLSPQF